MIRDALLFLAACLRVGGLVLLAFAAWAGVLKALTSGHERSMNRRRRRLGLD